MPSALEVIQSQLAGATSFVAIFGALPSGDQKAQTAHLKKKYRQLVRMTHPDQVSPAEQPLANTVFPVLVRSYEEAQRALQAGRYDAVRAKPTASAPASSPDVTMRSCTLGTMATLRRLSATSPLIFEGAQGILIDEWHGFHPYTTWSTTTSSNANTLLRELMYQGSVTRYGVVRAYSTRHGPGPFPSESSALTTALPDSHNHFGVWQREFRVGWLDLPLTRYALSVSAGTDAVVLTHLDRWATLPEKKVVTHYRLGEGELSPRARSAVVLDETVREPGFVFIKSFRPKTDREDLIYQELLGEIVTKATPVYQSVSHTGEAYAEFVGMMLDLPVTITSYGKTAADKRSTRRLHMVA